MEILAKVKSLFNFLKNTADIQWANPSVVGDPANPTYNGREVILTDPTINAFTAYMNSKTFPFNYDQASAFFSKDLWSSFTGQPATSRSAVAGYAFIGSVCGTNRYSIQEEFGGFQSVTVVTHELGHKYRICIIKSIIKL